MAGSPDAYVWWPHLPYLHVYGTKRQLQVAREDIGVRRGIQNPLLPGWQPGVPDLTRRTGQQREPSCPKSQSFASLNYIVMTILKV